MANNNPITLMSYEPGSALSYVPLSRQEAFRLVLDPYGRGHTLFGFTDLGCDDPVWLPGFRPDGEECFRFEAYAGERMFGWGVVTMSTWLYNRRELLNAKRLLLYRAPRPPQPTRREKIFNPKKNRLSAQRELF